MTKANSQHEDESRLYFGSLDGNFVNGIRMDIRARLAIEFLKAGMLARPGEWPKALKGFEGEHAPKAFATFALDLATEFIDQSIARGLTKDLPDTAELTALDRLQIERQVRTNIYGQHVGNRIMAEEADRVARPPPGLARP